MCGRGLMFCPNCGKQIPGTLSFCVYCNTAVTSDLQQPVTGDDPPDPRAYPVSTNHISPVAMYLGMLYCSLGAQFIALAAIGKDEEAGRLVNSSSTVFFIAALIAAFVLLYQIWRFVIHESRCNHLEPSIETPGKAVGYLFIPFYNLY